MVKDLRAPPQGIRDRGLLELQLLSLEMKEDFVNLAWEDAEHDGGPNEYGLQCLFRQVYLEGLMV